MAFRLLKLGGYCFLKKSELFLQILLFCLPTFLLFTYQVINHCKIVDIILRFFYWLPTRWTIFQWPSIFHQTGLTEGMPTVWRSVSRQWVEIVLFHTDGTAGVVTGHDCLKSTCITNVVVWKEAPNKWTKFQPNEISIILRKKSTDKSMPHTDNKVIRMKELRSHAMSFYHTQYTVAVRLLLIRLSDHNVEEISFKLFRT